MLGFIQRIQRRPPLERRSFAFWTAFVLTACIAGIWILTLLVRSEAPQGTSAEEPPSPLSALFGGIADGVRSLRDNPPF